MTPKGWNDPLPYAHVFAELLALSLIDGNGQKFGSTNFQHCQGEDPFRTEGCLHIIVRL